MRAFSGRQSVAAFLTELAIVSSLPAAAALIMPGLSPLVAGLGCAVLFPVVTGFYGLGWGAASAAFACAGELAVLFLRAPPSAGLPFPPGPGAAALVIASLAAALCVAFARNRIALFRASLLERFREAVHQAGKMRKQSEVLERVNRVLESRISSQKDSITILHDQVRKLASLSLGQALDTILETVALFTEMSVGAVWRLDADAQKLVPAATWGWPEGSGRDVSLSLESSVEGYVFRNRKPFSARMLLDDSEFDRFSTARTVMALPVVIGARSWGVLSVEDLPFERYSHYTETMMAIILSLAEPYLRQITEFEALNAQNEVDPETGYPLFSILHKTLAEELERLRYEAGFVSLVVLEITNLDELLGRWTREQLKRMLFRAKDDIDRVKRMKSKAFHFKEDGQLVLLVYGLDHDGTSFFCLDLLSMFSGYRFSIEDADVPVELIVGFSSSAQSGSGADVMIGAAEYLLSIQRL